MIETICQTADHLEVSRFADMGETLHPLSHFILFLTAAILIRANFEIAVYSVLKSRMLLNAHLRLATC